jgi:hypothetical protein
MPFEQTGREGSRFPQAEILFSEMVALEDQLSCTGALSSERGPSARAYHRRFLSAPDVRSDWCPRVRVRKLPNQRFLESGSNWRRD